MLKRWDSFIADVFRIACTPWAPNKRVDWPCCQNCRDIITACLIHVWSLKDVCKFQSKSWVMGTFGPVANLRKRHGWEIPIPFRLAPGTVVTSAKLAWYFWYGRRLELWAYIKHELKHEEVPPENWSSWTWHKTHPVQQWQHLKRGYINPIPSSESHDTTGPLVGKMFRRCLAQGEDLTLFIGHAWMCWRPFFFLAVARMSDFLLEAPGEHA